MGACAAVLQPLVDLIRVHVLAGPRIHGDDTPVPLLAKGKTIQARLWAYVRDDRPFGGTDPPAAVYDFSRDRGGAHPARHLAHYGGILQADAYAGFNRLYEPDRTPGPITEAACWAHARRKFFVLADIAAKARGKKPIIVSPLAFEAVKRIDAIFALERDINGVHADERLAWRHTDIAPLVADLERWMRTERARLSRHADVAKAMDYMLKRWPAFTRFLDDGRICLSNNVAERALRAVAMSESFHTPSSSICKHCGLIFWIKLTRATFTPHRPNHALGLEVGGPDLIGRARNDLLCGKDAGFDQPVDAMAGDAAVLGGVAQGQPHSVFLGRTIGMDAPDAPNVADSAPCPGLALSGRQSHAIQRRGDVVVRPSARHAPDYSQSVVRGAAVMLSALRLTEPKLGVLAALPVYRQNDLAGSPAFAAAADACAWSRSVSSTPSRGLRQWP